MMICPETYYEEYLKGKTVDEIMSAIRGLKREIGHLKNIIENPNYVCTMHPSERVRLSCTREYLERAKIALVEAGGTYTPSKKEVKAEEFDANIDAISKVIFSIGGYFGGYETRTYAIDGEKLIADVEHSLILKPSNIDEPMICEFGKEDLLDGIRRLHIGEWLRFYSPQRWNMMVLDGTQWSLEIQFSNGYKTVKIEGDNDYPYNFDELQELLGACYDEEEYDENE